jgi:hypothetical protein
MMIFDGDDDDFAMETDGWLLPQQLANNLLLNMVEQENTRHFFHQQTNTTRFTAQYR